MEPRYLGDGVYASEWLRGLKITTGSHLEAASENVVYLEPEVVKFLKAYIEEWLGDYKPYSGGQPQDE